MIAGSRTPRTAAQALALGKIIIGNFAVIKRFSERGPQPASMLKGGQLTKIFRPLALCALKRREPRTSILPPSLVKTEVNSPAPD